MDRFHLRWDCFDGSAVNGISKRILPRTVKERNKCLYILKKLYCVIGKKKDFLVYEEGEVEANLK